MKIFFVGFFGFVNAFEQFAFGKIATDSDEQNSAEDRKNQNQNDPGQIVGKTDAVFENLEDDQHAEEFVEEADHGDLFAKNQADDNGGTELQNDAQSND